MANLLITNRCNRKCSFCFAQLRLDAQEGSSGVINMSVEEIHQVMDVLEKSGERDLRLLGGEPTLHPEFARIVKDALARGFHVHMFTNAIMPKSTADYLASLPAGSLSLLCNISPQATDSEHQQELRAYALKKLGNRVQLGITLTEPEFEFEFLINLILSLGLMKRIRIGIAQPIVGKNNLFLSPSDYRAAGVSITRMATRCIQEDILIGFDCGMTMCMFSGEEFGILAMCSEGFVVRCAPIIDIGPGMEMWHCFPLSDVYTANLANFTTRNDAVSFYRQLTEPYRSLGCKPECMCCDYLRRGQCSGGCLAHAMNSLTPLPPRHAPPGDTNGRMAVFKGD